MNTLEKQKRIRFWTIISILVLGIIVFSFLSLNLGAISISPKEVIQTLMGQGSDRQELVLFKFRMPGIILALLIGAGLAVSGTIMQGITQNGLADPGILGINSGAGFAIVLFLYFFQGVIPAASTLNTYMLPFVALIGAFTAAILIYAIAWKKGVSPIRLVLVGIGVNAAFGALLTILQLRMDPQNYRQVTIWLSGEIWSANWNFVFALLPWMLILIPIATNKARNLNVFHLGDDVASGLGTHVERERGILLLIAVALAGAAVAAGGAIAFLGLVVPHIVRKLVGPLHHYVIPISALLGAFILMAADMVGSNILAPTTIPVGIVVSIVSTPYFVYLLMKTN